MKQSLTAYNRYGHQGCDRQCMCVLNVQLSCIALITIYMMLRNGHFSSSAHNDSGKMVTSIRKLSGKLIRQFRGFREIVDRFYCKINFQNPNMHPEMQSC